jgi:hypothetical protein
MTTEREVTILRHVRGQSDSSEPNYLGSLWISRSMSCLFVDCVDIATGFSGFGCFSVNKKQRELKSYSYLSISRIWKIVWYIST